jgi:hypothetical protein
MPRTSARLFTFNATPEYREHLDWLAVRLGLVDQRGDHLAIVEAILARVAAAEGVTMPPRTKGIGGKRAGAGRPKSRP